MRIDTVVSPSALYVQVVEQQIEMVQQRSTIFLRKQLPALGRRSTIVRMHVSTLTTTSVRRYNATTEFRVIPPLMTVRYAQKVQMGHLQILTVEAAQILCTRLNLSEVI